MKTIEQNKPRYNKKYLLYRTFFSNFIPFYKPSRTESSESDIIIDRNGKRKKPL